MATPDLAPPTAAIPPPEVWRGNDTETATFDVAGFERELTAASELTAMLRDLHGHFEQVLATCLPAATAGN